MGAQRVDLAVRQPVRWDELARVQEFSRGGGTKKRLERGKAGGMNNAEDALVQSETKSGGVAKGGCGRRAHGHGKRRGQSE